MSIQSIQPQNAEQIVTSMSPIHVEVSQQPEHKSTPARRIFIQSSSLSNQPDDQNKACMTLCPTAIVVQKRRRRMTGITRPRQQMTVTPRAPRAGACECGWIQRSRRSTRSQPAGVDLFGWLLLRLGCFSFSANCLAKVTHSPCGSRSFVILYRASSLWKVVKKEPLENRAVALGRGSNG